jgi:hypothetical protein
MNGFCAGNACAGCCRKGGRTDDGAVEVLDGVADGLVGAGIADLLEELEVAVSVASLTLSGAAEDGGDVWQPFHSHVSAKMVDGAGERGEDRRVGAYSPGLWASSHRRRCHGWFGFGESDKDGALPL